MSSNETFVSFAQNFEDVMLWRAFKSNPPSTYVDIGANHPTRDSVSYAFYLRGWRGITVEPLNSFGNHHLAVRPKDRFLRAAVSCSAEAMDLLEILDSGLSTGDKKLQNRLLERGYVGNSIKVPVITLAEIFAALDGQTPEFLKIDVEGMEGDVLKSWGQHSCRPKIVLIEAVEPNTNIRVDKIWSSELFKRGYKEVFFDGINLYYLHEDNLNLGKNFLFGANVLDDFVLAESSQFVRKGIST